MNEAPMTEKQLSQTIVDAARDCGWLVYRTFNSRYSPAGYPDLHLIRNGEQMFMELKSAKGKTTPKQDEWLAALKECPDVDVRVVYPSDLEDVYRLLVTGPTHAA